MLRRARGALRLAVRRRSPSARRLRRPDGLRAPARADRGGGGARARLEVLAESADQPGFVRAAARFVRELARSMVEPPRLTRALRPVGRRGPAARVRRGGGGDLPPLPRGPRRGRPGGRRAVRLARARRPAPRAGRWGAHAPVFVYGFDDFTRARARRARDARAPLRGRRGGVASLRARAPGVQGGGRGAPRSCSRSPPRSRAAAARRPLRRPSRAPRSTTSSAACSRSSRRRRRQPGAAVSPPLGRRRARRGGAGGRAVLELLRDGTEPGDVAVVFRDPGRYASLLEQVFGAYGIPYSIDRTLPLGHTGLGRGLLALIRAPRPTAAPRTCWPTCARRACCDEPGLADRLEAEVRKEGAHTAAAARERWERDHWPLDELDRLRDARDTAAFVAELEAPARAAVRGALRAPRARCSSGPQLDDARALTAAPAGAARAALGARRPARRRSPRLARARAARRCTWARRPSPTACRWPTPEAIRARRFEAVFVVRPPGGRVPARRGRRSRSSRTTTAARSPPPAACVLPAARGPARPRALPLLRLRLARRARCSC